MAAQKNLSREAFQGSVKPLLTGILNDFYQMISLFPEFPKEIIGMMEDLDNLEEIREALKSNCPRELSQKCAQNVDELRRRLSSLEAQGLTLWLRQRPDTSPYMTGLIGLRYISEFLVELRRAKGTLDNASFLMTAKLKHKTDTYSVVRDMDELQTMLSLAVVEFIPFQYKEDFRTFFFNFVHPVEVQITKHKNYEFLNRNVNSLNFAINLLNQNLTKRNKKTPEGMAPYLSLIHNRWNNLLRYYL